MSHSPSVPLATPSLLDVELYLGDPYPRFRDLRASAPVSWQPDPGFFAVTTHAEVLAAVKDHETFSSASGTDVDDMPEDFVRSILHMDPPRHTKIRKLLGREFAPSRVAGLEPMVRELARQILDAAPTGVPVDFAATVSDELPMRVLGRLIGIPVADDERFKAWNQALIVIDPYGPAARAITQEMVEYFSWLRGVRLDDPRDDVVTRLAQASVDGRPLDDRELFGNLRTLMTGGQDTTSNLISGGLVELSAAPAQWHALRADHALLPTAIEEMLRHTLGVTHLARRALVDTRLGDVEIAAGSTVALFFLSANRDERVFDDPDRFDIGRSPNPHLAFGLGRHFCIGAPLARLEARVMFEELLTRFDQVETADVRRLRSRVFPGIEHMTAVLHPASARPPRAVPDLCPPTDGATVSVESEAPGGAVSRSRPSALRERGQAGEVLVGAFTNMGSGVAAEILALSGYDWLVIDLEHGAGGDAEALAQLQAIAHTDVTPLVRVASGDRVRVLRALDLGAGGVLVPQIEGVDQARHAVDCCRYSGLRGVARYNRAWRWGMTDRTLSEVDRDVVCAIQIETPGALDAVEEIAAVDGVDVLFVGPADLARGLGIDGPPDDPRLLERVAAVADAAAANGKLAGMLVTTLDQAAAYRRLGFTFLGCSSDSGMLVSQARSLTTGLRGLHGPAATISGAPS
jgi:cytochrome P450/2-keto-3-deoxy-L-rhamnonate aldolase RhmA